MNSDGGENDPSPALAVRTARGIIARRRLIYTIYMHTGKDYFTAGSGNTCQLAAANNSLF